MTKANPRAADASPYYGYLIEPSLVFTSESTSLTLTIINPLDDPAPGTATQVKVTIPAGTKQTDLVSKADQSQIGCTIQTTGWQYAEIPGPSGTYFRIYPNPGVTLAPGACVTVSFSGVNVLSSPGTAAVQIVEVFGSAQAQTSVDVTKKNRGLGATARVVPPVVGAGEGAVVAWSASEAAYVTIVGPIKPGVTCKKIPVSGSGIFSRETHVIPNQDQQSSTYQVTAWQNDGTSAQAPLVAATLSSPVVTFDGSPLGPLDIHEKAILSWNVRYAEQVYINPPLSGAGLVGPRGAPTIVPGEFLVGNDSSVTFTLRATGFQPPKPSAVTFDFNPAQILWFRYLDPEKQSYNCQVINGTPDMTDTGGLVKLTVTGPGGPFVQYLGPGPYLEVQYFAATPNPATPGATVTLQWITLNATSLTLQDGANSTTLSPVDQGTTQVTPSQTTTYVLLAKNASGQQVTSQLVVTVGGAGGHRVIQSKKRATAGRSRARDRGGRRRGGAKGQRRR